MNRSNPNYIGPSAADVSQLPFLNIGTAIIVVRSEGITGMIHRFKMALQGKSRSDLADTPKPERQVEYNLRKLATGDSGMYELRVTSGPDKGQTAVVRAVPSVPTYFDAQVSKKPS